MCRTIAHALLMLMLAASAACAQVPRLTFRADLDGTLDARVGAGAPEVRGAPVFAEGRTGKAFVADGKCVLAYPAAGSLDKAAGTVAMWVKPSWTGNDGRNHSFFSDDLDFNKPADNNLHLWKWMLGDQVRFDIRTESPRDVGSGIAAWKPGEWHHLAAAWDCRSGTRLFLDGNLVGTLALTWEPKQGGKFFVGANWAGQSPAEALIEDVRIYSAPLDAGQVARIAAGKDLPVVTPRRLAAPDAIVPGRPFALTLEYASEAATPDALPLSASVDGLPLQAAGAAGGVRLVKGDGTCGPLKLVLPSYYHAVPGMHELRVTLGGAALTEAKPWVRSIRVAAPPAPAGPAAWRFSEGKVLRGGQTYLAPGDGAAFWFDGAVRPYDAAGQALCKGLVASGRIVDAIPCRLVDEVECASTGHAFREWGASKVVALADGRRYRIVGARESVAEEREVYGRKRKLLPAFQYRLAARARPVPHLLVAETLNDRERVLETAIDMAPGSRAAPVLQEAGIGSRDLINLNVTYTGREYPCDGKPFQQVTLFYPKSDAVTVTLSDSARAPRREDADGAAVSRLAVYEVTADFAEVPAEAAGERHVSLFYPWANPLANEYGFSGGTAGSRRASADCLMDYLRFMGFNRLEFHPYQFGRSAEFESRLFPKRAAGDVFEDVLPVAKAKGIQVVPRIDSLCFYLSDDAGKELHASPEAFQVTRKGETMRFFGIVPDPLHPEAQKLLEQMLCELAEKTRGWSNVPAVGFRANGKFGNLYVGTNRAHPPEESGYSEFNVREFEKETGVAVGGTAGDAGSRYAWLRANAWEKWIDWRCRRIHDHWVRLAAAVRAVDPAKKLIVFTKIPSNDPGEKRDWEKAPLDLLTLHRYHGYDPALYTADKGLSLYRVMGVDGERYWPQPWNKTFFYKPELSGFFRSGEPDGVELYYIYWELPEHPLGFRVGPGSPRGRAYYEPMAHALRTGNPGGFSFYNWFRATMGHEADLREFCRAFRGLPMVEPKPFPGRIEPIPDERLAARLYRDRIGIVNDSAEGRDVTLVLPKGYAPAGLRDLALNTQCAIVRRGADRVVRLRLRPWDIRTLAPGQ